MLNTDFNLESADDFYEALIDAHRGLEEQQSHALNAKLVLLLANHVGSLTVLREALSAARANTLGEPAQAPSSAASAPWARADRAHGAAVTATPSPSSLRDAT
jgi:hypothetical protein